MGKKEKDLEKARNNPRGWKSKALCRLLKRFDFHLRSGKGSHIVARHLGTGIRLTIPNHSRELSPYYVKEAVKAIEQVIASKEEKK